MSGRSIEKAVTRLESALQARARLDVRIRRTGITPALAEQVDTVGARVARAEAALRAAQAAR